MAALSGNRLSGTRPRVQHLLRRAGFGYDADELEEYVALGVDGAVARLLAPERVDDSAAAAAIEALEIDLEERRVGLWQAWHVRLEQSQRPLLEKLTYFWHDHFATAIHKVGRPELMQLQNQTLRAHALGSFRDLVLAVTRDPAMMRWLDNHTNVRGAPNENYARERMELHTMGEDQGYSETDIKEAARALTGWALTRYGVRFVPRRHDPGSKTLLGVSGNLTDADVIDILAERPETAAHLGRKLWRFFAVAAPTEEMIERTSRIYFATDGNIRELVRTILSSEEMYSDEAYRWRVKSPVEVVIGAAKALELPSDGRIERAFTERMGQLLFGPSEPRRLGGRPRLGEQQHAAGAQQLRERDHPPPWPPWRLRGHGRAAAPPRGHRLRRRGRRVDARPARRRRRRRGEPGAAGRAPRRPAALRLRRGRRGWLAAGHALPRPHHAALPGQLGADEGHRR